MRARILILFAALTSLSLALAPNSKAAPGVSTLDILVEPYFGYGFLGTSSIGAKDYASYNSFSGGARAGVQLLGIVFVAIDGTYYPSLNAALTSAGSSLSGSATAPLFGSSASNHKIGLTAGATIPLINLRAWLGYNFLDQVAGTSSTTLNGYSVKLGVGYKIFPFLGINAEYISAQYLSFSEGGSTQPNPQGVFTNRHFLLSVSAPLTF